MENMSRNKVRPDAKCAIIQNVTRNKMWQNTKCDEEQMKLDKKKVWSKQNMNRYNILKIQKGFCQKLLWL